MAIFISEPALPPIPVYTDMGIENRQCAPSSSPFNNLSRILAQEASLESSTSTPYLAKSPNSLAATSGAQSVRGINPNLIFFPGGFIRNAIDPIATSSNENDRQIFFI